MKAYHHEIITDWEGGQTDSSLPGQIVVARGRNEEIRKLAYTLDFFSNQGRTIKLHSDHDFAPTRPGWLWSFEVEDVVNFYWQSGCREIRYLPGSLATTALLRYWLLHITLPVFFTVEEIFDFLHGGSILINGRAIIFTAQSNGGKSTITDFFYHKGHTMLSDDKVAVTERENGFYAVPSHPHQRPYREKENLGRYVSCFADQPVPVQAIFVLKKAAAEAAVKIRETSGVEKFKLIRMNCELNLFFLKPKRLDHLARLLNAVPVYQVSVPWRMDRLGEVYRQIVSLLRDRGYGEAP